MAIKRLAENFVKIEAGGMTVYQSYDTLVAFREYGQLYVAASDWRGQPWNQGIRAHLDTLVGGRELPHPEWTNLFEAAWSSALDSVYGYFEPGYLDAYFDTPSEFTLYPEAEAERRTAVDSPSNGPTQVLANRPPGNSEGVVLVVMWEEHERALTKLILEAHGFEVLTACSGDEAIHLFQIHQENIDLVLLNRTLPEGPDGCATFEALRAIHPGARCALTTACEWDTDWKNDMISRGAIGVIWKPWKADEFAKTIREWVAR